MTDFFRYVHSLLASSARTLVRGGVVVGLVSAVATTALAANREEQAIAAGAASASAARAEQAALVRGVEADTERWAARADAAVQQQRSAAIAVARDALVVAQVAHDEAVEADLPEQEIADLAEASDRLARLVVQAETVVQEASDDDVDEDDAADDPTAADAAVVTALVGDEPASDDPAATTKAAGGATVGEATTAAGGAGTAQGTGDAGTAPVAGDAGTAKSAATAAPAPEPVVAPAQAAELVVPQVVGTPDATVEKLRTAVDSVTALTTEVHETTTARVAAIRHEQQREVWRTSIEGYGNGRVPGEKMCAVSWDSEVLMRCDAAEDLEALNAAFRAEFGRDIKITDSYRSYAGQVACRANKGSLCARPGTSNHGWGRAADLGSGIQTFGTPEHDWMVANAAAYHWTHPDWAQQGGGNPEAWHWEYTR